MAAAYAELDDVIAPFVVTRGPGAASAANAVANAYLDRQPVLALTDAVSSADTARIAHQRLDQSALFTAMTNWSARLGDGADMVIAYAITRASGPRPGPVHLDFDPTAPFQPLPTPAGRAGHRSGRTRPGRDAAVDRIPHRHSARRRRAAARRCDPRTGTGQQHPRPPDPTMRRDWCPTAGPIVARLFTGATMEAPLLEAARYRPHARRRRRRADPEPVAVHRSGHRAETSGSRTRRTSRPP